MMEDRKMTSKSKLGSFIFILISAAILLFPAIVKAEYAYQKAITINHTKVPATLTNFPVLVSIANDNDLKNHVTSPNGYDLVFKDIGGTQLNHELEKWDGSTGTLIAWVRVPTLTSTTDTIIYMCYGDSGVTTSQENKTGVWDSNYKGVWHLPNGITLNTAASNTGGNSFTVNGVTATGGQIDGAANFVRSSSTYLSQASDSNNNVSGDITASLWIFPTYTLASGEYYTLIHKDNQYSVTIFFNGISWADGTNWSYANFGYYNIGVQNNVWQHLVVTKTGTTVTIYLNGVQKVQKSFGSSGVTSRTTPLALGTYNMTSGYYGGYEDEVRLSNVARSAGWIQAEYNNQSSPSTFYAVGSEGQGSDITPPVVTAFVIPSLYNNLTVPITTFTATDNVGVTGYLVNESPSTPSPSDPSWSPTPQTQYTFSSEGNKTLYAWARDAAGNNSNSLSAALSVVVGQRIYGYDELNRLIRVLYEDGSVIEYTYDGAGNRLTLSVVAQEAISTPSTPTGPASGTTGTSYTYTTGGSSSSLGHSVQYLFDWGDGTNSDWLPVGQMSASKSWTSAGTYNVKAQARCSIHTSKVSPWSGILSVGISSPDTTPPTPSPMTWATAPYQTGISSMAMVAATASDPSLPINYYFHFTGSPTGGTGGADSAWQSGTSYTNSGLQANQQYGYQVKARDGLNNETTYSTPIQYAYTAIEAPSGINLGTITSTSIQVQSANTPSGLARGSSGLFIENTTNATNSGWKQDNGFWTSSPLSPNTSCSFRAKARNGNSVETGYCSPASKYTLANVPGTATFSNLTQTCIRANWTANGNPSGTQYYCENTTAGTNSGWITNTYWDSCGLVCGTSYSFRVKAKNSEGIETNWTNLGSQATTACTGITVVSPNGGESWKRNSTYSITWSYTGNPGSYVKIELLKGGAVNRVITNSTSIGSGGSGSYSWRIPSNQTLGSDYKIRVTSTSNGSYTDTSNNNFSITR
jgi:YD repeat-containing protein